MYKKSKLEYKLSKGDISKYITTLETITEIKGINETKNTSSFMEINTTQKILNILPEDVMEAEILVDSAMLLRDGKEYTIPEKNERYTLKMKRNGAIIEIKGRQGAGDTTHSPFPEDEISPGDRWSGKNTIPVPGTDKSIILVSYNKLEGFEQINGYDCAKITLLIPETTVPVQEGIEQTVKVEGNTFFDYLHGRLIKTYGETKTIMNLPGDQSITTVTKMNMEIKDTGISNKIVTQNPLKLNLSFEDF